MKIFIPLKQKQKDILKNVNYSDHTRGRRKGILINSRSLDSVQYLLSTFFDVESAEKGLSIATPKPKIAHALHKKMFTDNVSYWANRKEVKLTKQFISDEYDGLIKLPRVDSVYVHDGIIHVRTKPLTIQHPRSKKVYCIGVWDIRIDYSRKELYSGLRLHKIPKGYGLHTGDNGNSCYGTAYPFLDKMFLKMRTRLLAMFAIKYLTSLNEADGDLRKLCRYRRVK